VILNAQHAAVERRTLAPLDGHELTVYRVDNRVGEAPLWDAAAQCLWWVDIRAPELLRLDPATGLVSRWRLHEPVGALAQCDDGRLLLALRTQAWRFDPATDALMAFADIETDQPANRLNEGKVSPSGRWWLVGSMDDSATGKQPLGSLYRVDASGAVHKLHSGLTVANGIAWSLDGTRLYFSDSFAGRIFEADWDEAEGRMGAPRVFADSPDAAGRPDGAVVDAQGHYLSAGVSAGCLNRFAPDGRLLSKLSLPCRAPTMPCFGGAGGQDLFITSLVRPDWTVPAEGAERPDGQLYCLASFGHGQPGVRLRV
jgi:sugar lactone lactonase YvrE